MQPQAGHPPKLATPTAADHSAAPQRNALGDRSNDGLLLDSQISAPSKAKPAKRARVGRPATQPVEPADAISTAANQLEYDASELLAQALSCDTSTEQSLATWVAMLLSSG